MEAILFKVGVVMVAVNLALTALDAGLGAIVSKTETKKDDMVYGWVHQALSVCQKIVQWLGANRPNAVPAPAQAAEQPKA